jgi:hypothetical protein
MKTHPKSLSYKERDSMCPFSCQEKGIGNELKTTTEGKTNEDKIYLYFISPGVPVFVLR